MLKIIIGTMIIAGLAVFLWSLSMKPYTNEEEFKSKYRQLKPGQEQEFFDLRREYLTNKYIIQDIGLTITLVSLWILRVVSRKENGVIVTPPVKKLKKYIMLLPLYSAMGDLFYLFQGSFRGEFPRWADSIGIPIMGLPMLMLILYGWARINYDFLESGKAASLRSVISFRANPWILVVSVITIFYLGDLLRYGIYWNAIPVLCWLYFYLCIGAINNAAKVDKINKARQEDQI